MAANQSSGGSRRSGTPKPSPGSFPGRATPGAPAPSLGGSPKRPRSRLRGGPVDDDVQTFRSPTALIIWVVWLLFAVANLIDLAVQGRDHTSVVAAAILLLVTGIAYTTAQRPKITADDAGITIKNPLRDHRIGWASVVKVDLVDLLRVHCDWNPNNPDDPISPGSTGAPGGKKHHKVISAWAVHYSRRRQLAAEVRPRRTPGSRRASLGGGFGRGGGFGLGDTVAAPPPARSPADSTEKEAELAVRLLSERATRARAETVWATGTVDIAQPPTPDTPDAPTEASSTEATPDPEAVTGWLEPLKSTWSTSAIAAVLIPALILLIVCLVH